MTSANERAPHITACPSCDALLQLPIIPHRTFRCPRCDAPLHRAGFVKRADDCFAFGIAAVFAFILANCFPIVAIESAGDTSHATLLGAANALRNQGMYVVAVVVALTTVLIPALELATMLGMVWCVKFGRHVSLPLLFRLRRQLRPWSMIEIFVLGSLVAIVKLGSWASVIVGTGLWSLGAYIILQAATVHAFEALEFWNKVAMES